MNPRRCVPLILLVSLLCASCSGAPEDLPPEVIVDNSAVYMRALDGFAFRLQRTGAPVYVDPSGVISFREAEGIFVAPDKVQTTVKVIAPGIVAEVDVIGIGDLEWETNVFSGEWALVPPEYAFQPAVLFAPVGGIQQALEDYLYDIKLLGLDELEELPGLTLYHLQGVMDGANVHNLTVGMIDEQMLAIELWIQPGSFELHRALIFDPPNPGVEEGTTWQFDFWDFDRVIKIVPPV